MDALIGSTGFVGGHLCRQHHFEAKFNSRNIDEAAGRSFQTVVCAAAPGSMFEANRFPERDGERVEGLIAQLGRIGARRFVLVSSIAVLDDFAGGHYESTAAFQTDLAYGRHRRQLEVFCQGHFADCLIVRLPALFGEGLKKNFLFDILNPVPTMLTEEAYHGLLQGLPSALSGALPAIYTWDALLGMHVVDRMALEHSGLRADFDSAVIEAGLSALRFTHPESRFQYYEIARLWSDIGRCEEAGLKVIHLAPEPLSAGEVFRAVTQRSMPVTNARVHREDMWTRHGALWGRDDHFIEDAAAVLPRIVQFCEHERMMRS
jgi:hypothetical protein